MLSAKPASKTRDGVLKPARCSPPITRRVCDLDGKPLLEATLDYWQNAANGLYWQIDPEQPTDNLRCQMKVDDDGQVEIVTIRPVPYEIPTDVVENKAGASGAIGSLDVKGSLPRRS